MTKLPPRTNTDIAMSHMESAHIKMAKALPYILTIGHIKASSDLTVMIEQMSEFITRFNDPDSPPLLLPNNEQTQQ